MFCRLKLFAWSMPINVCYLEVIIPGQLRIVKRPRNNSDNEKISRNDNRESTKCSSHNKTFVSSKIHSLSYITKETLISLLWAMCPLTMGKGFTFVGTCCIAINKTLNFVQEFCGVTTAVLKQREYLLSI